MVGFVFSKAMLGCKMQEEELGSLCRRKDRKLKEKEQSQPEACGLSHFCMSVLVRR